MDETAEATRNFALYFAMPLWMGMGFADYLCHRATKIERTSGLNESLLHSLMLLEMSVPVLLCLYFEVTSLVILLMVAAFFIHEATALYDVAYTQDKREIWLIETHIHSYLGVLPFMMGALVLCIHWNETLALFGFSDQPPVFSLIWKRPQFPLSVHLFLNTLLALLLVIPYAEEAWRCYRASRLPKMHPMVLVPANR